MQATTRETAIDHLRRVLQPGQTVYTILRHVSRSGMSRDISLVIVQDGKLTDITAWAGEVLGYRRTDRHGSWALRVGGCGMDMGFHTVYSLASALWHETATWESWAEARESYQSRDEGYMLNQDWL